MQVSITVKVRSIGLNDPATTTPVKTMNCWLTPVLPNHATGNAPAACPAGGFPSDAVTIGDSPAEVRLGAEHGVPVRIGIDRDGDPQPLLAAGATHVVRTLTDILPIVI